MKHPPGRRRLPVVLGAAVLAASAACGSDGGPLTINVYYSTEQAFDQVVAKCTEEADGRYQIALNILPRAADGQREQMVRRLAAGDTDMDILGLDVTWVAEFAEAGWIEEWTGQDKADVTDGTLEGPLRTATWEDKLYAAPKNTNVQLLWYREDITPEPPGSWPEMLAMAEELRAAGKPYTVLMTGAQYEGLVVQYNTLVEGAGGRILSEDKTRAVFDEGAVEALEALRNLAVSPVSSPSLANAQEDDIRLAFQDGGAAFQLNWPYVYAAMTDANPELIETLRWAPYPAIDPANTGTATLGGFNLAISAYSEHKPEAFEAAKCLRSAESQLFSAINSGVPPTIESVYFEPEMEEAYPMRETILAELKKAAIRPLTPAYQNVSTLISTILSPPRGINPQETVERLRDEVQDALDSKGVLP